MMVMVMADEAEAEAPIDTDIDERLASPPLVRSFVRHRITLLAC